MSEYKTSSHRGPGVYDNPLWSIIFAWMPFDHYCRVNHARNNSHKCIKPSHSGIPEVYLLDIPDVPGNLTEQHRKGSDSVKANCSMFVNT